MFKSQWYLVSSHSPQCAFTPGCLLQLLAHGLWGAVVISLPPVRVSEVGPYAPRVLVSARLWGSKLMCL